MERTTVTPTPQQLRALTHPVRLRMLGLLRIEGPATSTTLATRLGLNTGATSYHLRQLAQHGFIVDDEGRGTGRERWWRAAHTGTRTELPARGDRAAGESMDAYLQAVVTVYAEELQRAMEERPLLPAAWRDASTFSDYVPRVTAARAQEIRDAVDELLAGLEDDDNPDAVPFVVQVNAFPRPGVVAPAASDDTATADATADGGLDR